MVGILLDNKYIGLNYFGRSKSGKTVILQVINKRHGDIIGVIEYHVSWRKYVFSPNNNTLYSSDCLIDIGEFLKQINIKKKDIEGSIIGQ